MRTELKRAVRAIGYILVCGEALWLFLSFLTLIAASLLRAGVTSALLERNVDYLAAGLSFFARSLLPGAVVGFALLIRPLREDTGSLWLPASLLVLPLAGVAQSAMLSGLLYGLRHQGSALVLGASIFWLAAIIAALASLARHKLILYAALAAVIIGFVWGAWMFQIV